MSSAPWLLPVLYGWSLLPSRFEHVCPLGPQVSFAQHPPGIFTGLVFAVCIFWNFPFRSFWILTGHFIAIDGPIDRGGHPYVHLLQTITASQVLHRLAPSTAVGTTRHYLLDCMVIFCTPFTFHFFRPSSLFDVCSPCGDELQKAHSFISRNCHPGHVPDSILGLKGISSISSIPMQHTLQDRILWTERHLVHPPFTTTTFHAPSLVIRQPRSLPSSLLCLLDTWHPPVLGSSCQHG